MLCLLPVTIIVVATIISSSRIKNPTHPHLQSSMRELSTLGRVPPAKERHRVPTGDCDSGAAIRHVGSVRGKQMEGLINPRRFLRQKNGTGFPPVTAIPGRPSVTSVPAEATTPGSHRPSLLLTHPNTSYLSLNLHLKTTGSLIEKHQHAPARLLNHRCQTMSLAQRSAMNTST